MYGPPPQRPNSGNGWGPYAAVVLLVGSVLGLIFLNQKKKVFISYDHSEDAHYRRLLGAWDANSNFKFEFDDVSPREAIDSRSAAKIKAALTPMIKRANYLLVIVGEKTHASPWVEWEVERAQEPDAKLKIVAVKVDRRYESPGGLLGVGTTWAYAFTRDAIIKALESAK